MECIATFLTICVVTYAIIRFYFHYGYKYWERRNFPFVPPKFPLGNSNRLMRTSKTFNMETVEYYNKLKKRGLKFGGVYTILRPVLVILDPEYIKDVLTKDFQYFVDRGMYYNKEADPASGNLFALDGADWKNMRVHLTPTFTTGKMKSMFAEVVRLSENLVKAIGGSINGKEDIDLREMLCCYTTDVITSIAFGIDSNCFEKPNGEFRQLGIKTKSVKDWAHALTLIVIANAPRLGKILGLRAVRDDISEFCKSFLEKTIKYREENKVKRTDFLQLLIDMKNEGTITMDELIAQVILFFIAGFDTSNATMMFALYELCRNPDIQDKVRTEINTVLDKSDGQITYDNIREMKYLQQVIDESQRMYPPLVNLQRTCIKDYQLRGTDLILEKGTPIVIPLISIQNDPDHYPEPEKFDPERFNDENKRNRHPYLHLPFGEGPRNCIGLRFGVMQSKIGLIQILRKFKLRISPSTKLPLTLNPKGVRIDANEVLYLIAEKV